MGIKDLAALGQMQHLTALTLDLSCNNIGAGSWFSRLGVSGTKYLMGALDQMQQLSTLKLDLTDNQIGDAEAK